MSRTTKTTFKAFDYMHCDDFARYLKEMATKGWHFKEWGAGLKFEKGEPKQVEYAVEVFTKASENDLRPEPNTQEFAEYCEAAGWKLVDAKQKFCIFKKVDENAVEILTPEERVRNSFKATFSVSNMLLLFLYGLNAVLQISNLFGSMFWRNIFSTLSFFNVSVWILLALTLLIKLVNAVVVRRKLLKQLENGESIYIGSNKDGKKLWDGNVISTILLLMLFITMLVMLQDTTMVVYFVSIFVVTITFAVLLAKFRPEASTNVAIQVIFVIVFFIGVFATAFTIISGNDSAAAGLEKAPLKITDYRESNDEIDDVSVYREKNMLGSSDIYILFGENESIQYGIYRTKHDWILDRIWNDESEYKYNETRFDCTKEWAAVEAYRNKLGEYYVRYDDLIFMLSEDADIHLEEEQISIIREKLDLR